MPVTRDLQLSAFPDIKPDRPVGALPPSVIEGSNAHLLSVIAPYYLADRTVMDVTYGRGAWWRIYRPEGLICHDRDRGDGVDYRHLPEADQSVDVVCFDPPYVPAGGVSSTDTAAQFRDRYGIDAKNDGYRPEAVLRAEILDGVTEAARVAREFVLVKAMEFVSSSRFHDWPVDIAVHAREIGLRKHDTIVHRGGAGPGGHNIKDVKRARRHHSYLLVFTRA